MEEVVQQPDAEDEVQIPVFREDSTVGMEIQPIEWFAVEHTTLFDRPRVGHANFCPPMISRSGRRLPRGRSSRGHAERMTDRL